MRIDINGLRAVGFHGVRDYERRDGQEFVVDVTLNRPEPSVDALPATVDYSRIANIVTDAIQGHPVDLIETLAGTIAGQLLRDHPSLRSVCITVHKPNAPLKVPFDDVICRVKRRRDSCPATEFVLSLGTNLGDLDNNLRQGLKALAETPGIDLMAFSSIYRTAPVEVGDEHQPDYHNLVVIGLTTLTPHELLRQTASIEHTLGRTRPYPHAPRIIDVDIIAFGEVTVTDDELALPHPRAWQRAFVLIPWAEIAPSARLPQGLIADLVASSDTKPVSKLSPIW
ncbi:MAG: 2-amino-4-hydroxy-6-hydroxymethyldihydropteridine diphosphokinase [Propionibacteriaceae bacterium]|nr:2-amino-4-hydroxy-6-hydroxymethyldihydropteridine diphosphokinase [Propionibacteriaceae bacterium]